MGYTFISGATGGIGKAFAFASAKKGHNLFLTGRNQGMLSVIKDQIKNYSNKIEQNETQEEALIREIKEELKSDIEVIRYIGVSNHEYTDLDKPFSITMYAYLCKLINGDLELTEHIDSCYADVNEMKLMDFAAADIPLINLI